MSIVIDNNTITFTGNLYGIPNGTYNLNQINIINETSTEYTLETYIGFKDGNLNTQNVVIYTKSTQNSNSNTREYITLLNQYIETQSWDLLKINQNNWELNKKNLAKENIKNLAKENIKCCTQKHNENRTKLEPEYITFDSEFRNIFKLSVYKIVFGLTTAFRAQQQLNNNNFNMISYIIHGLNSINFVFSFVNTLFTISIPDQLKILDESSTSAFAELTMVDGLPVLSGYTEMFDHFIGTDKYDIGHVLGTGNNSWAIISSIGTGSKGRAFSALQDRGLGKAFMIDSVCHEIGHQHGMNHPHSTINSVGHIQVEPLMGSTIMAYARPSSFPMVQYYSDCYFNSVNIIEGLNGNKLNENNNIGNHYNINNSSISINTLVQETLVNNQCSTLELRDFDENDVYLYSFEQNDHGQGGNQAESRSFLTNKCYRLMNNGSELDTDKNPINNVLNTSNQQVFRLTKYKRQICSSSESFINSSNLITVFDSKRIVNMHLRRAFPNIAPSNMPLISNYNPNSNSIELSWETGIILNSDISVYGAIFDTNFEYIDDLKFASGTDNGSIQFNISQELYDNLPGSSNTKNVQFKVIYNYGCYYRNLSPAITIYSPDSGTCMTGDTLINTEGGLVEIQNLKGGYMILTNNGYQPLNKLVICDDHEPHPTDPELNRFIKFPKGCLSENIPSQDLYLTTYHPLVFGEKKVRAKDFVGKNLGIEYVYRKSKNYNLHFRDIQYYQIYNVDMESHILDTSYKPESYISYEEVFN
jgi:hypothetical protein